MTARALVKALGGHWHGSYGMCLCPSHDDGKEPALKVVDADDGGIVIHCFAGCNWRDVKAELRRRGRLPDDHHGAHRRRAHSTSTTDGKRYEEAAKRSAAALVIWRAAKPAPGTAVEAYLASRGIAGTAAVPSLRYHPNLRHGPSGLRFEAMVAAVQGPDGKITGIHRTYLLPGGRGKARVRQSKMMLGRCAGGAVRFASAAPELVLGEGIESTLSVSQATGKPAWATLSTSGLRAIRLPPEVETVIIAADGDEPGEEAAQEAARRFIAEGRTAKIARPPIGFDFNDLLQMADGVAVISDHRRRMKANG